MSDFEATLRTLREALRHSPDNLPLRKHLVETLMGAAQYDEAVRELRAALQIAPHDAGLKLGIARAYLRLNKMSHALVVVEELLAAPETPPEAYVLHARLLIREGEIDRAVRQYQRGVELDASAADAALEAELGVGRDPAGDGFVVDGRERAAVGGDAPEAEARIERPKIGFGDVGGMDAAKEEIRLKIIYPLQHPELYRAYGKAIGGGILFYGPPGCGKTHLARATAGEVSAGFMAIGLHDVLEMWIGQSERNLHEIFETARRNRPCVLFFDEVDALGASRADFKHSASRQTINQFLSELDGATGANDGVLILAATNAPWHLDGAFRRPGRFDRIIFVPPPDAAARTQILGVMVKGKPQKDVDLEQVAKRTDGFSGADLKAVVDQAVEAKLREAMKKGVPTPLGTGDLLSAAKGVRPSTKEWFASARNYALYANEGGMYDEILKYLKIT